MYKIQMSSANNYWGDLKESIDEGPYEVLFYCTKEEAEAEAEELNEEFQTNEYRVVHEDIPEDINLY